MNLPKNCHHYDKPWMMETLAKLKPTLRDKAVRGYDATYDEIYASVIAEHEKDVKARKGANIRLMKFVDNVAGAANGDTFKPERKE